ncbi:MAG TPA: hypothetical protein VFG95_04440 [Nitrospiria bacterium]|nr:hypothetical protein [Nitrospiria bacterium]
MSPEPKSTLPKPFVFVLMPFDPAFDDIYKFGIKGAADDVGAYAERIDEQIFNEGILDRIFNQISKADVIVADMTGRNPNVFYEVGYAHALGKIVVLLTQKAADIPFDLKHRQHTVYGGKIEQLRHDLAAKLRWGIAEAKKQRRFGGAERFSVRVHNVDIPEGSSAENAPEVRGTVSTHDFYIPVHLRNDAFETASGISHVYLFTTEGAEVVPCEARPGVKWISGPVKGTKSAPKPIRSFVASATDAADGLTRQYRLPITFPALPPGAVELSSIHFIFKERCKKVDAPFRLRLHSPAQYHDYPFRLNIKIGEKPKRSQGRTAEEKK